MSSWADLTNELAIWREQGLTLPVWWRDDDAIAPSTPLDQLLHLSDTVGLPVHLAVIPQGVTAALAERLADTSAIPVTHGFAHVNHAPATSKKMEYGTDRPLSEIASEIGAGLVRLNELFGDRLAPMFVPPWNRIAPEVLPLLADAGYGAISTYTPRESVYACDGLIRINTHIDPINWRGDRSVVPPDQLLAQTVTLLKDRRAGKADNTEPLGLLTHHLVHDSAIRDFTAKFIETLMAGPVTPWSAHILKG